MLLRFFSLSQEQVIEVPYHTHQILRSNMIAYPAIPSYICVCPSIRNAKCVFKLKGYFLRSEVDKIWREDMCRI